MRPASVSRSASAAKTASKSDVVPPAVTPSASARSRARSAVRALCSCDAIGKRQERGAVVRAERRDDAPQSLLEMPERYAGHAAADVEGTDDVERQRLVMHVGDRLEDAVVAELEVGGRQARHRTPSVGHERVDAHPRHLALEAGALGGRDPGPPGPRAEAGTIVIGLIS